MPRRRAPGHSRLAWAACGLLVAACNGPIESRSDEGPAVGGAPAYGDTFIQASIGDIGGLIPSLTSDQSSHEVGGMIYDGLVKLDRDLKMVPSMAESWTYSRDCLELTFKLRRDVKWHDGRPFTADDVLFTYQTMINPKTPAPFKEGRPYLSRIVYRVIPSQATIFLELKAKGVDYVSSLTGIQYARQTEYPAFRKAYHKFRYPGSGYTFVGFNLKDPRFADLRVRQAFAHAINKQELIDGVRLGLAREATGPIRPGTWAYTDDVKRLPYDPEKAKALLAEAGWKDRDGDGLIEDQDGKPFTLTIRTNQGNDERKKIAELIQQRFKEIGIQVDIQLIEWAAFIKEFVKPRRFEVVVLGLGSGTDPDQFVVWHSSQRGPDQMNRTGYANPEVDRLLELGRSSCVQEERVQYYHRIQQILAEDLPMIFLYTADALPVVAARVRGVSPAPAGILHNFTEWFVPKQQQRYTSG